jgi:hypothetical protein
VKTVLVILIGASSAAGLCLGQTNKAPTPKPQKDGSPLETFVIAPTIAKDAACARDYVKSISTGGIEGRKLLLDLFSLECIESFDSIYVIAGPEPVIVRSASQSVSFTKGLFLIDTLMDEMAFGKVKDILADKEAYDRGFGKGLVLSRDVHRTTREAMARTICNTNHRDPEECAAKERQFEEQAGKESPKK